MGARLVYLPGTPSFGSTQGW